jgi:hypothetical protein
MLAKIAHSFPPPERSGEPGHEFEPNFEVTSLFRMARSERISCHDDGAIS